MNGPYFCPKRWIYYWISLFSSFFYISCVCVCVKPGLYYLVCHNANIIRAHFVSLWMKSHPLNNFENFIFCFSTLSLFISDFPYKLDLLLDLEPDKFHGFSAIARYWCRKQSTSMWETFPLCERLMQNRFYVASAAFKNNWMLSQKRDIWQWK